MKKAGKLFVVILFSFVILSCNNNVTENPVQINFINESENNTLEIYTIDPKSNTIIPIYAPSLKKNATLKKIVDLVVINLDEKIDVVSCKQVSDVAIVSFSKKYAPIKECKKKQEKMILECFSNSILDNLENCNKVIFQAEDDAYQGTNFSFEKDEVYATK